MKNGCLAAAIALLAVGAWADTLPGPVPPELIVAHNGLEWVWASPCAGVCSMPLPTYQEGWRYATPEEFANGPDYTAFLTEYGEINCAAAYFDPLWRHCDLDDAEAGLITSLPNDTRWESWFVRGGSEPVPEPASFVLVGAGLLAVSRLKARK